MSQQLTREQILQAEWILAEEDVDNGVELELAYLLGKPLEDFEILESNGVIHVTKFTPRVSYDPILPVIYPRDRKGWLWENQYKKLFRKAVDIHRHPFEQYFRSGYNMRFYDWERWYKLINNVNEKLTAHVQGDGYYKMVLDDVIVRSRTTMVKK